MTSFASIQAFIAMGGYADYVWSAYAIVLVALLLHMIVAKTKLRRVIKQLRRQHASTT